MKSIRKYWRYSNAPTKNILLIAAGLATVLTMLFMMNQNRRLSADPATYQPLLNLIANVESRDNYNAYFGNAANSKVKFTEMPIAEVMKWQKEYVAKGNPSSAVGRYQIIDSTLAGLVRELDIDSSQPFDKATQDKMAVALLERRGSIAYVNNELTRHEFAANLAKEWAALPKIIGENPEQSYYADDGLNASQVSSDKVLGAIEPIASKE